MARTRAAEARDQVRSTTQKQREEKKASPNMSKKRKAQGKDKEVHPKKAKVEENGGGRAASNSSKSNEVSEEEPSSDVNVKVQHLLSSYGTLPLEHLSLPSPTSPTASNILALLMNALLSSARISHGIADRSIKCLIEAGYQDLATLERSTFHEKTAQLTKGGYTRYREKTATELGELAEAVRTEYDGDLNNLLKRASSSPKEVRKLLKDFKGLGDVGADIFLGGVQSVWKDLAPFLDKRNLGTAKEIGLGNDLNSLWRLVGEDPLKMCKLSSALTTVRLDKKQPDFK